jgi:hypothetical protein
MDIGTYRTRFVRLQIGPGRKWYAQEEVTPQIGDVILHADCDAWQAASDRAQALRYLPQGLTLAPMRTEGIRRSEVVACSQ